MPTKLTSGKSDAHHNYYTAMLLTGPPLCWLAFQPYMWNFLIGISIDGPEALHDRYRVTRSGKGTFRKVMAAIELLKEYQIEFNTLTVINNNNVYHALEVYEFLKEIGSRHMQFIELLETSEPNIYFTHPSDTFQLIDFSVPSADYGRFMSTIFKVWIKEDVGKIFIRQFESTLSRVLGNGHTSCIFQEACHNNFVLESNGDVYECDHFVWPEYRIGNIASDSLSIMESTKLTAQKKVLAQECLHCDYRPLCNGGCPKHRINKGTGAQISYFCQGYKIMFSTMTPYLNAFVELARHNIPLDNIMTLNNDIEKSFTK